MTDSLPWASYSGFPFSDPRPPTGPRAASCHPSFFLSLAAYPPSFPVTLAHANSCYLCILGKGCREVEGWNCFPSKVSPCLEPRHLSFQGQ